MRAIRSDGTTIALDLRAPEATAGAGEALVRVTRTTVGASDLEVARGRPAFTGVLGHEFVGVVEQVGPGSGEAGRGWAGKRVVASATLSCGRCDLCRAGVAVHCRQGTEIGRRGRDGCLAERVCVPLRNLAEVPRSLGDDQAVFAQVLAGVLHAAQIVSVERAVYATILGDGAAALLAAQVLARQNTAVRLLGDDPARFTLAEKWGVKHRHCDEAGRRQDQDAVLIFDTGARWLGTALGLVRPRGTIVLCARPEPPAPDLGPIVEGEIAIRGARSERLADAVDALARGGVDVLSLVTRRMRLADGPAILRAAAEPGQVKVLVEI